MSETLAVINFPQEVIVDDQLVVRIMQPSDAERIREILDEDPDIRNHMGWMDDAYTTEELAKRIEVLRDGRNARYVAVEDDVVQGYLGMWPSWKLSFENEYDLGYFAAKSARGRGIIRRSATALMDAASESLDVSNFTVFILEDNTPSQAAAAGLGFVATEVMWEDAHWGLERRYIRPAHDQTATS